MQQLYAIAPELTLPMRPGAKPRTQRALPHVQLDQWPPPGVAQELIERALKISHVRPKQSRMANPSSIALCLPDDVAEGPREAFIDDHEFCHLHALPEGGIHLTLPSEVRAQAMQLGWAEQHPAVKIGIMPPTLVMVYSPRNGVELDVVFHFIRISCAFAQGQTFSSLSLADGLLR
jgi:hypothetical protein